MASSFRQFRQLRAIERQLRRSDPRLAAMLAIFARLNAGEAIISREQERPAAIQVRRVLAVLAGAIAGLAASVSWVSSRIARPCAAAGRWLRRAARIPFSRPSPAGTSTDPRRSLGL